MPLARSSARSASPRAKGLGFGFLALASTLLVLAGCASPPAEPPNVGRLKAEIRAYVDSGRYQRDIAAVAAKADTWLVKRAAQRKPDERLAVVFDLDETLLSNWPMIQAEDLGGSDATWTVWLNRSEAPPIEAVREVYRTARRLGFEVFYLTGRHEQQRGITERNLQFAGCGEYAALLMKPETWKGNAADFKTAERARLTAEGHVIVANLGDQDSDLSGGFAERIFKLPDPFYFTP
jgi:predicted secreted acid phosphatase